MEDLTFLFQMVVSMLYFHPVCSFSFIFIFFVYGSINSLWLIWTIQFFFNTEHSSNNYKCIVILFLFRWVDSKIRHLNTFYCSITSGLEKTRWYRIVFCHSSRPQKLLVALENSTDEWKTIFYFLTSAYPSVHPPKIHTHYRKMP